MKKFRIKKRKKKLTNKGNVVKTFEDDVTPKSRNKVFCIVLGENKSTKIKLVSYHKTTFSIDKNTYFLIPEGIYLSKNKVLMAIYMEGISTPLSHKNIEKEQVTRNYVDRDTGKKKKITVQKIKGLKYDSRVIDIILNPKLAEIFTKVKPEGAYIIIGILSVISIIIMVIGFGLIYTKLG